MKYFVHRLFGTFFLIAWLAGFAVAKGFWSTLFCLFPFWAWYLVVEKMLYYFQILV